MSQIVHTLLVAAAVLMGFRIAFHLVVAHALTSRGSAWKPTRSWHAHLALTAALIAAAATYPT